MPPCTPTIPRWLRRIRSRPTPSSPPKSCSTPSTRAGSSARARCSRSTATRTASSRWGSTRPERFVVAKFYRPGRWSDAQILEEHAFVRELADAEIPVVAPLAIEGRSLHAHGGFRFALYPRRGGRAPDLDDEATLEWLGRFLGRIHALGAHRAFAARPALDVASFGVEPRAYLLAHDWLPRELKTRLRGCRPARDRRDRALPGARRRRARRCACTATPTRATSCGPKATSAPAAGRPALRRLRRRPHGAGGAGPVDAASAIANSAPGASRRC